ncbi:uncharacterized protein LOC119397997 [Rhipicephalus sanguineus]|uniref:uncharacterized protein LOC119397997 n=1 Tax=Rhipicephalus sanguineus TaxID=34632 RepID=UPI001894533E|nr:uncharacterized protein LOC119397997 [Rhipicephalus sanguineus]
MADPSEINISALLNVLETRHVRPFLLDLEEMVPRNQSEVQEPGSYEDWIFSLANATGLQDPPVSTPVTDTGSTSQLPSNCAELPSLDASVEDCDSAAASPTAALETDTTPSRLDADKSCSSFCTAECKEFHCAARYRLPSPMLWYYVWKQRLCGEDGSTIPSDNVIRWLRERVHCQDLGRIVAGEEVVS